MTARPGAAPADRHHPAAVAFARLGGVGTPWVRSPIPMGRGLGYSGAVRVGGAVAARRPAARHRAGASPPAPSTRSSRWPPHLEGHADNAAASLLGGVVATAGGRAIRVPLGFDPAVVVWIPAVTTSTEHSRNQMPAMVSFDDAVHNIGHVAMLVSALAAGDTGALRDATSDRLHQERRSRRRADVAAGARGRARARRMVRMAERQWADDRDAVQGGVRPPSWPRRSPTTATRRCSASTTAVPWPSSDRAGSRRCV